MLKGAEEIKYYFLYNMKINEKTLKFGNIIGYNY